MLPAFVIEEIRKRERLERELREQPYLELPIPGSYPSPPGPKEEEEPGGRGITIIEL